MLIYVCSSSHGFGHAARDVAVLQQIRVQRPQWKLVISSCTSPAFLDTLIGGSDVGIRCCRWDVGMVQSDALQVDRSRTLRALTSLDQHLPPLLERESRWIREQNEPVLIIGDIPAAAADLADRAGAVLVWMSNFGWDSIYQDQGQAFAGRAEEAHLAYRRGQHLLRCPFDLSMDWGLAESQIGLVCGDPRPLPTDLELRLQERQCPVVQIGFGGLGLQFDSSLLSLWPDHHFVMATPSDPTICQQLESMDNVTLMPAGVRPLDLFPHCQRHLGKPGFSTFSEALTHRVGLHVVERDGFAEVTPLMEGLRRHGSYRELTRDQLMTGAWQLNQSLVSPTHCSLAADGAQKAAEIVIRIAES